MRHFLERAGTTALANAAIVAALTLGGLYFGIYLRWMIFVLVLIGLVQAFSVSGLSSWSRATDLSRKNHRERRVTAGLQQLGRAMTNPSNDSID